MDLDPIEKKISELLEEKFRSEEFSDCFLVDIKMGKSSKLQVFVDCDNGINLERCGQISRHLESWLDESQVLGEKYILEVSSPGVDRPLIKRQYPKNIGRKIQVTLKDGTMVAATLGSVTETSITLEGILDKKETKSLELQFDDIQEAIIIVSF